MNCHLLVFLLLVIPHCPFLVGIFSSFLNVSVKKCKRNFMKKLFRMWEQWEE